MPRLYRGRDVMEWLDAMGVLDERAEDAPNLEASRRAPSLQLVGSDERRDLNLSLLEGRGIRIVGRALAADGTRIRFADDVAEVTRAADTKLERLLRRIDTHIANASVAATNEPYATAPVLTRDARTELDLDREGIRTIVWATGHRGHYPWLSLPVLDERGELIHDRGVTTVRGVYALGLRFLRRRKSSFLDGVGDDARELTHHLEVTLRGPQSRAA
jgi:putative flavoprotein involved in K+ transport